MDRALQAASLITTTLSSKDQHLFYRNMTGDVYPGLAFGNAGIALFFLKLYMITESSEHRVLAKRLLDFDLDHAVEDRGELKWARSQKHAKVYSPYWTTGNAGMGLVLLRFYDALKEDRYLELAKKAACHLKGKFSVTPGYFSGMAGLGGFLIEMYRFTQEEHYLNEARHFVHGTHLFRIYDKHGVAFPGEDLIRICHDLATGSAGIGLFYLQLKNRRGGHNDFCI